MACVDKPFVLSDFYSVINAFVSQCFWLFNEYFFKLSERTKKFFSLFNWQRRFIWW